MNKKSVIYGIFAIGAIFIGVLIVHVFVSRIEIESIRQKPTVVYTGDYSILRGTVEPINGEARVNVEGDLTIDGILECENGSMLLFVNGDVRINNQIICNSKEGESDSKIIPGIRLVVGGSLFMGENALIETDGHIQIVDSEDKLAMTVDEVNQLFEEASHDSGEGSRIGPFITKNEVVLGSGQDREGNKMKFMNFLSEPSIVPAAWAETEKEAMLTGRIIIKPNQKNINQLVYVDLSNSQSMSFSDLEFVGFDGSTGKDDVALNCTAQGEQGQNALRLLVKAVSINIENLLIDFGSGGRGGNAETRSDCDLSIARGGAGGKSGNFKLVASQQINIRESFVIQPGKAGGGGDALARGKGGVQNKKGGDAEAYGGSAENNEKAIRALGEIEGAENIEIGSMVGGTGGKAMAIAGHGGENRGGGLAKAVGGQGGNALIYLSGSSAGRTPDASDIGGRGGDAEARGGNGGQGANGSRTAPGKDGGVGGDALAVIGKGGISLVNSGENGNILQENGGNGGTGGAGCGPGKGGAGGVGQEQGKKGQDGKNLCPGFSDLGATTTMSAQDAEDSSRIDNIDQASTEDDIQEEETQSEVEINIIPKALTFTHYIDKSTCPQVIGEIEVMNIGEDKADGWKLKGGVPAWLTITNRGSVPSKAEVSFSCQLMQYEPQELDTTINLQPLDSKGREIGGQAVLEIKGTISD